ncbi:MAG: PP2C family protein-serine/threonine phosphatase [Bryobacteraceae bacterium]
MRLEKVSLFFLLLWLVLFFTGTTGADAVQLLLYILAAILAVRYSYRAIRRSIWRLRNRLIVSYLFIAVVPLGMLVLLMSIVSYTVIGQMAIYIVQSSLDRALAAQAAPITPDQIATLAPDLGDVFLLSEVGRPLVSQNFRRRVPPPINTFDVEVSWLSPITLQQENRVLAVRTRPSAVLRSVFGQKLEWRQGVLIFAVVVSLGFLVVQLASIVVGVSITRTITAAVHDLYEGTRKVGEGDFAHRIPVHGRDQLSELSVSFNRMTEEVERLIVVEKERERLHSELEIARQVQSRLFPKSAPETKTLQLTGVCYPAQAVSGDYFDYIGLPHSRIAVAIGDVAGKGISAALLMAAIQSVMRTQLLEAGEASPARLVSLLNRQLYASTAPEKYATFWFGVYDDSRGLLTYTNAGHLPPILVRGGTPVQLEVTGTVVGAFPASHYEEKELALEPGDVLVAFTDGIVEPENSYGEMFGEQRIMDAVAKHHAAEAGEIIRRTVEAVRQWSASPEQEDDMTMIIARRLA